MTDFVGVSNDPDWGVAGARGAAPGLYEFKTDLGVPVRLHEATFLGFEFRVGARQSLTTRFVYDDPEWTPPEASATPLIEFCFDDVQIRLWEEVSDPNEFANDQANSFDYYEAENMFAFSTYAMRVVFTAERVEVRLHRAEAP